jgi:hypothetical protein
MNSYEEIINTKWPPQKEDYNHLRMNTGRRAKIFLPFAALTGYEEALEKTLEAEIQEVCGKKEKIPLKEE